MKFPKKVYRSSQSLARSLLYKSFVKTEPLCVLLYVQTKHLAIPAAFWLVNNSAFLFLCDSGCTQASSTSTNLGHILSKTLEKFHSFNYGFDFCKFYDGLEYV